jgi:hypothetical protein
MGQEYSLKRRAVATVPSYGPEADIRLATISTRTLLCVAVI